MKNKVFSVVMRVRNSEYPQNGEGTVVSIHSDNGGLAIRWDLESMRQYTKDGITHHYPVGLYPYVSNIVTMSLFHRVICWIQRQLEKVKQFHLLHGST